MDHDQQPNDDHGRDPDAGARPGRPVPPPPAVPPSGEASGPSGDQAPGHLPPGPQAGQQPGWGAPPSGNPYAQAPPPQGPPSPYGPAVSQSPYGAYGAPAGHSPYGQGQPPVPGTPSRRPGIIPLVPLALGDILGGSFSAIRRNAAAIVGTSLIVALVEIVLTAFAATAFFDSTLRLVMMEEAGLDPFASDPLASPVVGQFFGSLGALLLAALVTVFTGVIASGVLSVVILRASAGLKTSLGQAWRLTGRQVWSLAGLGALYLLAGLVTTLVFGGVLIGLVAGLAGAAGGDGGGAAAVLGLLVVVLVIALVVAWVWIYVKLLLAPAAAAVELKGPWQSMGRSWTLTRGHWWRTFGIMLLVGIIVGIIASVITTPLSMIGSMATPFTTTDSVQQALDAGRTWMIISIVATTLVNAIGRAYLSCVMALLYVDYRIRHESFDLDLAAAADEAGSGDDERFSTFRDVQAATGTDQLVPGRRSPSGYATPR